MAELQTQATVPSLSIVMPVYNEPLWVGRAIADVVEAVRRSPFNAVELVVVDDGSDEPTQAALAALEVPFPHRVIRQDNGGRFAARATGIAAAENELVLLIDSRVSIEPDALAYVAEQLGENPQALVWNAHAHVAVAGNPYARFWNVLTEIAFRDYFERPRRTSFGLENFDRFPKGTTCFLAPRTVLAAAIADFSSLYEDSRDANDDTVLIRHIAGGQPINISPGFACLYRGREALRPFLRHSGHRGVVFVDGFLHRGTRFYRPLQAFYPLSALAALMALRHPKRALWAVAAVPAAFAALALRFRRPPRDVAAVTILGPLWAATYTVGLWRGGIRALRARMRR